MEKEFLELVEAHQGIIYKVCKMYRDVQEDQEDLFQEIVLQLWKAFPKFRNDAKVSTWMYRIGLNTAITQFRKRTVNLELKEQISDNSQVSAQAEISENEERMFDAIRKLNPAERALIALFLEDYNYKEMADILGITENYVGVKIGRVKDKLKDILNQ